MTSHGSNYRKISQENFSYLWQIIISFTVFLKNSVKRG